ncbi:MAG: glutamine--fructose-6-phosphate transaminase (isomerizing) [Anaerolineaceae bacterium]|jgi:glucosamine--fructose-6-phosphate aminotransferase (isomerizing)|nr:MAG: glutamine--fructose-6-phosphate transaminase (isomerizing) [Anaerolineaceae bacterium]
MCGIVGYIGEKNATPIILGGLKKLEYRGYDSAGIAVIEDGHIELRRDVGKLTNLETLVKEKPLSGRIGIGHTRWATHGAPSAKNAHPHVGETGKVVIVHNGIVENYMELKEELEAEGALFNSETDTETIVHLIERNLTSGVSLEEAVRQSLQRIKGAHGIVVISSLEPDKIIAARIGNAGGVVIGYGEGENFVASDIPALMEYTRKMSFLETRQMAIVTKNEVHIKTLDGAAITPKIDTIAWDPIAAEKGNYRHFMQKEIHEQVRSLTDTISGRADFEKNQINLINLNLTQEKAKAIQKIIITACGTAYHAGLVGKTMIEEISRIPVEVDIASEFRYRDPIIDEGTCVITISQSGETADTLAAMEEARKKGAMVLSIVNAIGSQAMRVADGYISMQVGPEIGVASTKAFTAPLVDLYMLAIYLADLRGTLSEEQKFHYIHDLRIVPDLAGECLKREEAVVEVAEQIKDIRNILYLGRGINMPIAYEGALKLKEISYIHAEAYPAGEMKHGPIALIDKEMPVLAIMPKDKWYEKMLSQVEQAKARGGILILVATDGDENAKTLGDHILWIPEAPWMLTPIFASIPLQMLAYHIAALRGLDVDQPRNLAKSVTVE